MPDYEIAKKLKIKSNYVETNSWHAEKWIAGLDSKSLYVDSPQARRLLWSLIIFQNLV